MDHFKPDHPESYIITTDRGYESYDMIFHCECQQLKYVFRVKAPTSSRSLLSSYIDELPYEQEEFDVCIRRYFTNCSKNMIMASHTEIYHYMNSSKPSKHLDILRGKNKIAYVAFRVLKIKTSENECEYIITNLPYSDFSPEEIKQIYHLRWGIEVSFRYLKHAAGMLYFHSKKIDFIHQEIYASLTLYNFGIFLANLAIDENDKKNRRLMNKHQYSIDISQAIKIARKYLTQKEVTDLDENIKNYNNIIKLMMKYVHAVKTNLRLFERHLRSIGAIHFNYR